MKEVITMVKGYVDDIAHLLMSFVAIGAVSEVIFGSGIFGVNVIGNLTSIITHSANLVSLDSSLCWCWWVCSVSSSKTEKGSIYSPFF